MSLGLILNIMMGGLLTGLVYGLAALGLSVVWGVVRVVNLAHGGIMVAGMYAAALPVAAHGADPLLALPVVAAGLFVAGFMLQRFLIARTAALPESVRLLLMVGVALMVMNGLLLAFGPGGRGAPPVGAGDALGFGPFQVDRLQVRAALLAVMVTVLLFLFFNLTGTGKAIRACADSPFGAEVIGLDVEHLYAVTFGLGAAVTGVAGCLLAQTVEVRPTLAVDYTVIGFLVVLAGGPGSVGGALLAGMLVGMVEALSGALLGPGVKELAGCGLLLLILLLRPRGLSGEAEP